MSTLRVLRAPENGSTAATLLTVRKWERRPLERREIEIRIPRGTRIKRLNNPSGAQGEQDGPRVETRMPQQ